MTKFVLRQQVKREKTFTPERSQLRNRFTHLNLAILLLLVIAFAGISYLYYINQTATGGFDIKGLENQLTALQKENKQLETAAAERQSLSNIEVASQNLQMVATIHIDYLPAIGSAVAVR